MDPIITPIIISLIASAAKGGFDYFAASEAGKTADEQAAQSRADQWSIFNTNRADTKARNKVQDEQWLKSFGITQAQFDEVQKRYDELAPQRQEELKTAVQNNLFAKENQDMSKQNFATNQAGAKQNMAITGQTAAINKRNADIEYANMINQIGIRRKIGNVKFAPTVKPEIPAPVKAGAYNTGAIA
jgi:thioester reductase-like protein